MNYISPTASQPSTIYQTQVAIIALGKEVNTEGLNTRIGRFISQYTEVLREYKTKVIVAFESNMPSEVSTILKRVDGALSEMSIHHQKGIYSFTTNDNYIVTKMATMITDIRVLESILNKQ